MSLWVGFSNLASNLGMSFENIILLVALVGCIIFYAIDFKIGTLITFFISGLIFMLDWHMYSTNYYLTDYSKPAIVMLICFVLMAMSIYAGSRAASAQAGIL